jgi:hypothetical protein
MKLKWTDLSPEIQGLLENNLLEKIPDFSQIGLLCFLDGALLMNYQWMNNPEIKKLVFQQIWNHVNDNYRNVFVHSSTTTTTISNANIQRNSATGEAVNYFHSIVFHLEKVGITRTDIPIVLFHEIGIDPKSVPLEASAVLESQDKSSLEGSSKQ